MKILHYKKSISKNASTVDRNCLASMHAFFEQRPKQQGRWSDHDLQAAACYSFLYGCPSAAGIRERPINPASTIIVAIYGAIPNRSTGMPT
jgi:hypothetical protein